MVEVGLLDGGRAAGAAGIIGVPVDLEPGVGRGLQQQREILAPVAGHHGVGARCLDLGDVGREIGDLQQRMQFVADDLDVRPLGAEHRLGGGSDGLAERVVLVDQVDVLDGGRGLHVVGERLHLDVGVGIPAEMPEAALVVGQHRIDRGIVEVQDFLAGIALVVLGDEIRQRAGDRRTVALGEDSGRRHRSPSAPGSGFPADWSCCRTARSRPSCRECRPWRSTLRRGTGRSSGRLRRRWRRRPTTDRYSRS